MIAPPTVTPSEATSVPKPALRTVRSAPRKATAAKVPAIVRKTISKKSGSPNTVGLGLKCPFCERVFKRSQALGGHTSKAHNGQSQSYSRKQERREERTVERETLREAKALFAAQTGLDPAINRAKVTQLKKQLMARQTGSS